MRNINQKELNEILKDHKLWLEGKGGKCANLSDVDLRYTNLNNSDLRYVNLRGADLSGADLRCTNLSNANLTCANLGGANLTCANLSSAYLEYADLKYADLIDSNLRYVNLIYGDLRCANLEGADLSNADLNNANLVRAKLIRAKLKDVKTNIYTLGYNLACPEEGSFIGYKKANECIVKLLILEDSKRSSATSVKCRCDKAKVLEIENIKTGEKLKEIRSNYDNNFIYKVGETVSVNNFDNNRWNECSTGIHFFMNKNNAIDY